MLVGEVMTAEVVTVSPDTTVAEIARKLLEHHISGVPVVENDDRPLGIVSEGDLVRRAEIGTERGGSWWLDLFASLETRERQFIKEHGRTARQVMTRDLVTTTENADLADAARLLEKHHVKRLPVLRDGRIVGIVSRANLLRGIASAAPEPLPSRTPEGDRALRDAVLKQLAQGAGIAPGFFDATVHQGVVTLWGIAQSDLEETAAVVAAESVPGVVKVESNLGRIAPWAWAD